MLIPYPRLYSVWLFVCQSIILLHTYSIISPNIFVTLRLSLYYIRGFNLFLSRPLLGRILLYSKERAEELQRRRVRRWSKGVKG